MIKQTITLENYDKFPLNVSHYQSENPINQVVLINAALAVPQKYYEKFASYLCQKGFDVYTYDYGGTGKSVDSTQKYQPTMLSWVEKDYKRIIDYISVQHKDFPVHIVGHSFGGQIIGIEYAESQNIQSITMVASQIGNIKYWSGAGKMKMFFIWYLFLPLVAKVLGVVPKWAGLGAELPKKAILEWCKWCRDNHYLFNYIGSKKENYQKVNIPILAYSFTDDDYAPKPAVDALLKRYTNANIDRQHIHPKSADLKGVGHFGFFSQKMENIFWEKTVEWIGNNKEPIKFEN